jgi:hypothetical protein
MPKYQIIYNAISREALFEGEPGDHRPSVYFYAELSAITSNDVTLELKGPWQSNRSDAVADMITLHETVDQLNKL